MYVPQLLLTEDLLVLDTGYQIDTDRTYGLYAFPYWVWYNNMLHHDRKETPQGKLFPYLSGNNELLSTLLVFIMTLIGDASTSRS